MRDRRSDKHLFKWFKNILPVLWFVFHATIAVVPQIPDILYRNLRNREHCQVRLGCTIFRSARRSTSRVRLVQRGSIMYSRLQKIWIAEKEAYYRCTAQWDFAARCGW